MVQLRSFIVIIVLVTASKLTNAQVDSLHANTASLLLFGNIQVIQTDSGIIFNNYKRTSCKSYTVDSKFFPYPSQTVIAEKPKLIEVLVIHHPKLFIIHGNVSYDFFYRSKIDTPINQQNFQQHTERVYLDILVKEKYPLKVNFASRQSNSPYFKNFIDVNFNFDRYTYNRNVKQQILDKLKAQTPQYKYSDLGKVEAELKKYMDEFSKTKSWLEDPATLQKIIEEREKNYYQKLKANEDAINTTAKSNTVLNSINKTKIKALSFEDKVKDKQGKITDSTASLTDEIENKIDRKTEPYAKLYEKKRVELDSLSKQVTLYKNKADSVRNVAQKDVAGIQQKIYKATSEKELRKIAKDNGINIDKQSKLEKQLSAIKTFSIGRSVLNYTELTAQNITVTGINIEYNPSYYAAFTAGKIDYRFRDFYNRGVQLHNNQYIVMGRLGIGDKEHKALIFSYFTGRKSNTNYGLADSIKSSVNIIGYSLEAIYKKDANTSISAEFAKSTKPVTGNLQSNKQTGSLVKFSDQSNMGINIKAQTIIPETNTKLSGFFRKTGENFQSFSLFSYNTDQTAWLARADQSFLKNKVTLVGMLRRNDFTNPFTDKTYKTSTVFKSIQLNVRFPKYPSLSVGYYPGTQLYMIDKERIRESAYYILNGSMVYSYYLKGLAMNSSVVYNKYTNEATDSGFVAYKGTNYYASQSVFFRKVQLQGGYAYTKQPLLEYYTIETSGDYTLKSWLKMGIGAKYNNIAGGNNYWGESIELRTEIKKIGGFQLQYEKSYLPTITQTLYPVEIGRVSYYKNF